MLRLNSELYAELEAWAQDELRSVNGQIEYLLRQAALKRRGNRERPPIFDATTAANSGRRGETK